MKLSILDQSACVEGRGEDDALRDTVSLAEHAETLGYARFWVSEHHGLPTIVGTAPEILLAAIAARTSRIRLGSAGIMLPHYSAFKVAEVFRALDALAPGRMDLGVGRAPGGDQRTARALNPASNGMAEDFPQQVVDLMTWLDGAPLKGVTAHPRAPTPDIERRPDLWMLGSSDYGAQLAAHLGLPYAFAYFFMDGQGVEQALRLYRELYRPSNRYPRPHPTICIWALAADTDAEARYHALSRDRWRLDRNRGRLGPLRHPDDIAREGFSAEEGAALEPMRRKSFVGCAANVAKQLRDIVAEFELPEIVVNTWAADPAVRRHSYALLARELGTD